VQVVEPGERWRGIWENIESATDSEKPLLSLPFHELEGLELWIGPKKSGMAYHTYDRALLETLIGLTSTALQRELLQRQLLEEAAEKERLETLTKLKDDFLSLVSHDLRSPLSAISMSASLMARRSSEVGDEKGAVDATRIERNALRLTHMVERLLHAARVDAGRVEPKMEACHLTEVALAALDRHQLAADARNVVLESAVPEGAVVKADPLLLQEVLSNLVDNALKVSESDEVISVGAEPLEEGWVVTVKDQGPGIPDERIPTLFERGEVSGTMTRTAGFGLGLFLVHELVVLQGGSVELRSTSSEGTTFAIHLPE
jgi:signal transduction histidine kinase